jgi:HPt (histidine-containing phosphotransfer) domain-containing protein
VTKKKQYKPATANGTGSVKKQPSRADPAAPAADDVQADHAAPETAVLYGTRASDASQQDLLPGIDIETGLHNLRCDLISFKKILTTFYRQRRSNCEEIAAALARGDIDTAREILHGIAGSSGYLGAMELYQETLAMSEACRSGDAAVALERLPRFRASFEEVMNGLEALPVEAPDKSTDKKG